MRGAVNQIWIYVAERENSRISKWVVPNTGNSPNGLVGTVIVPSTGWSQDSIGWQHEGVEPWQIARPKSIFLKNAAAKNETMLYVLDQLRVKNER